LARLEEERSTLIAARAQEEAAQRDAAATLATAVAEVTALDAELTRLTERVAQDEARRTALWRQQQEAAERRARLGQRQEEIARQRAALEAEAVAAAVSEEAAAALSAAEAEVERTRAAADAAAEALRVAQAAEQAAREPMQALEARRAKLRAEIQALTELLAAASDKRWTPIIDSVRVEPGFEAALGAALGDDLTAPLDAEAPSHWRTLPVYAYPLALPGGATPLASHVTAPPALARRLAQIGVVADAEAVERDFAARAAEFEQIQRSARQAGEAERAERQAMRDALSTLGRAQERDAELKRRAAATASRLAGLAETAERLAADLAEAEARAREAAEGLAELPDPALGREEAHRLRTQLAERRTVQAAAQTEHDRLLREAASRAQRIAAIAAESQSWTSRAEAAARQHATIERRRAEVSEEIERLDRRPAEIAEQREKLAESIAGSTERRNAAGDALAAGETRLAEAEKASKAADATLAQSREERVRCEAGREQAEIARQSVAERITERLACAPEAVLATGGVEEGEELPATEEAEARLQRLVRERDGMGPVNLVAEAEATEIEEKLGALNREREDLTGAIAKLREGISALNREGRERLLAAFTEVNEHFTRLFTRLFGGGRAHLTLDRGEDGDETRDPLEAGLEILASPPGKRLQIMSLLSGGEQALTALALLFAVFLTNPAPICVLDEVDAPLDDANVDRFCTLVEEIAET